MSLAEYIREPTRLNGDDPQGPPASALIEEADAINEASGEAPLVSTSLVLAAWRGQEPRAVELIEACIQDATPEGAPRAISLAEYAAALLYNGLGRYHAALAVAQRACEHQDLLSTRALPELVEAGARSGNQDVAVAGLRRLEERTPDGATDWELGIQARSRALLSDGEDADALYRESLERLGSSRFALHRARAQLLYGEWLRRERRRVDAREQLRVAHRMFARIGAGGFAERAHRELLATGETARKRAVETRDDLTAQEAQIVRLAGDGYTNPEIGAELFISPRTVEWHLRKVFRKLGVRSRKQLRGSPPNGGRSTKLA
jgi:DNA-binding CsgD family transcriptional regulator